MFKKKETKKRHQSHIHTVIHTNINITMLHYISRDEDVAFGASRPDANKRTWPAGRAATRFYTMVE